MTKSSIISYITARWGDITSPKRLPIKDREVSNALLDELYPLVIEERYSIIANELLITGFLNDDIFYEITFSKSGNKVFVNGFVNNISEFIFEGAFLEIIENEYKQKTGTKQYATTSEIGVLTIFNNTFIIESIDANTKVYFNFNYLTND